MQAVTAVQWGITGIMLAISIHNLETFALWLPVSLDDLGNPGVVLGWGFALGGLLWFRYGIDDPVDYVAHDRRIEVTGLLVGFHAVIDPVVGFVWLKRFDPTMTLWHLATPLTLLSALALSYGISYGLDRRLILRPAE